MASSSTTKLKFVLMMGSVRENRMCDRVAKLVHQKLLASNHDVVVYDPTTMQFPLLYKPIHFYSDRSQAPQWLVEAEKQMLAADGFLMLSAEYNRSIAPALSNMIDHFGANVYKFKPCAFVCYSLGRFGGVCSAMQLGDMMTELGATIVPARVFIPSVQNVISDDGKPQDERIEKEIQKLISQLDWYAQALKTHKERNGLPSEPL